MPRKSPVPLELVTLNLVKGDREVLERFYPKPVGYQMAIRALVNQHVKALLERESRTDGALPDARPSISDAEFASLLGDAPFSGAAGD